MIAYCQAGSYLERESKMDCLEAGSTEALPPLGFLSENYFPDNSGDYHPCSAVIPSLPLAIKWLRDCVKQNPSLKLQVSILPPSQYSVKPDL